jgi:agmatine deiminase
MKKYILIALPILLAVGVVLLITMKDAEKATTATPKLDESTVLYAMPDESEPHEGTWLEWPHQYQYGVPYRDSLDATWVSMTKALATSEDVHIVAYDEAESHGLMIS